MIDYSNQILHVRIPRVFDLSALSNSQPQHGLTAQLHWSIASDWPQLNY